LTVASSLKELAQLMEGQAVVFHLAAAMGKNSNNPEISNQVNVIATRKLVQMAAKASISRFVHVSTMSAYGPPDREIMAEDHPLDIGQSAIYGKTKAQGELQAMKLAEALGVPLTVVRPGEVYGPRGRIWTVNMLRLVQRRVPVIFGGGIGFAQPVYVDNLVDGMILAAVREEAVGEAFNFIDRPLPWREFFGYYGQMCECKPLGLPMRFARIVATLFKIISRRSESPAAILAFYTSKSIYPIEKAKKLLGYQPRISIDEGMRQTESWLRETGYLPKINE
jgi:nucleoside-diphosphate-sugar epimerase